MNIVAFSSAQQITCINTDSAKEVVATGAWNVVSIPDLTCYFKITKKAKPGPRNVTGTNPDGQMGTLVNRFRVKT